MIVKMIQNYGNRMETTEEMINKDLEELKSKQTMMNNTISEIKNSLEGSTAEAPEVMCRVYIQGSTYTLG